MGKPSISSVFNLRTLVFLGLLFFISFFFDIHSYLAYLVIVVFLITVLYLSSDGIFNRIRLFLTNLLLFFLSIFIVVVLLETYLHLWQPQFLNLHINIQGDFTDFTSRKYLDESVFHKQPGAFRILGLGDSFAGNLRSVKKNYHDFLEAKLKANGRKNLEIVNAGMECTGPGYYWHILERYGDALKPDLVLVSFFVGNDVFELHFTHSLIGGTCFPEPLDPLERWWGYRQFKNLWIYQTLETNLLVLRENKKLKQELEETASEKQAYLSKDTLLWVEKRRMKVCEKNKREVIEKVWNQGSHVILSMKEWCDQRNIALVLAILPDQFQVDRELRQEIFKKYEVQEDSLDLSYPDNLIMNFCKRNNIHCVDMVEQFQKESESQRLYIVGDTHWNSEGNRLAAEIIYHYLQENNLVKHK